MSVLISQSVINYVEEENIPALKALLEKCKDVDERNECGQTPLMIAAEQGNLEIVKELIKNGANCNLEDLDNWTALISASKEGHVHIVEELLKCGVNLEHRDMVCMRAMVHFISRSLISSSRYVWDLGFSCRRCYYNNVLRVWGWALK